MYRVSAEDGSLASGNAARFTQLALQLLGARTKAAIEACLQGDIREFIPHDVVLSGWGNFGIHVIQYDLLGLDTGLQANGAEAGAMAPSLNLSFQKWIKLGCRPLCVSARSLALGWERNGLPEATVARLESMNSVLLHGIQDRRGGNDCLYAFFSTAAVADLENDYPLRALVPYLDSALRQVEPPVLAPRPDFLSEIHTAFGSELEASGILSAREEEILKWVAAGKSNQEICSILNLSSFTVKNYMQRIFSKLDVFNRAQAAAVYKSRYAK